LSYTNFIVLRIYAEALDRLRVRLNMYLVFQEFQPMCCWYLNITDRQTDDLLSHYRALR